MIKSDTLNKIAPALLEAQKTMGDAVKSAKNPFFKSSFADLNAVREAVMPALNQNGITVLQLTVPGENGRQFVQTTLLHESGEYLGSNTEIVCAKQNDPQAMGSAISYARRYGLQAFMCVGAADDDAEGSMNRVKSTVGQTSDTINKTVVTNGAVTSKVTFAKSKAVVKDDF